MELTFDPAGPPGPAGQTRGPLDRVLALQQIDHPASTVIRACRPVGTRLGIRVQPDDAGSRVADALGWICEQAYGYRSDAGRLARRAASAGAMYPVELLWLTCEQGRWQVFVHDFALRRSLRRPDDAEALARLLGLAPGQTALLPVAAAWRTVQRYGFRGYRYCVLDTAQVLGNVAAVVVAAGLSCAQAVIGSLEEVSGRLGLGRGELLMPALVLGPGLDRLGGTRLPGVPAAVPAQAAPGSLEQAPGLAPVMTRVHRLHAGSEPVAGDVLGVGALTERRSMADATADLDRRESARSFAAEGLGRHQLGPLRAQIEDFLGHLPVQAEQTVDVRLVRRSGTLLSSQRVSADREPIDLCASARYPAQLEQIFGQQPLAATAAMYLIIGLRSGRNRTVELSTYRQGLLIAGLLTSRLYRYCTAAGLATTALGGFHDEAVASLAGGGFSPLIVQALGNRDDANLKNDGLAATWLQPAPDRP